MVYRPLDQIKKELEKKYPESKYPGRKIFVKKRQRKAFDPKVIDMLQQYYGPLQISEFQSKLKEQKEKLERREIKTRKEFEARVERKVKANKGKDVMQVDIFIYDDSKPKPRLIKRFERK